MKEIIIQNQQEFDALPLNFDQYTKIVIIGELKSVNREISNSIIYVSGSAKIDYVCGSAKIGFVYGSAKIDYVSDSAEIGSVYCSAEIGSVYGAAKIGSVYGSAKIGSVSDSAKIGSVSDSAKIGSVYGSAEIGSVSGSAKIGSVYGFGSVNLYNESSILLFGFSAAWLFNKKAKAIKKSKTATVIKVDYKSALHQFEVNNPINLSKNTVILYKRVSSEFKTQEGTKNETIWAPGSKMNHPNWSPENSECGEGKFHACCLPIFCDQFRDKKDDKYVAIQVNKKDLFAWLNPQYPHKIAFRAGKVLYECDREGNKIGDISKEK